MKKVLIVTGIAVLALASVAGAQGFMFNTNLTVGSTGADVVALQTALMSAGYNIPAIASGAAAKGYFGSQTKAAVQQYQSARSIPSTGFVGPLTRAALNGGSAMTGGSSTVNCPAGYTCTATTPVAVNCPVGYVCTATGGSTGTISTRGAEGVITTKLASAPIADADIRISSMVPVYGVEVKAQGSDMIVDRVLLQIGLTVSSSATKPSTFITKLHAYDGSTLLRTWSLSESDFNKDSSDRYYVIASGLNFLVPKDATKTLTFKVDTTGVSSDQAARVVTFQGYAGNSQNVRAVDGANLNSYADMSGSANSRQQTFNPSGTSNLTVTLNSALTPKSTNNRVDTSNGVKGLVMQSIDVKSTTGDSIIKKLNIYTYATSTAGLPSIVYLYDGNTLVQAVSGNTAFADDLNFTDINLRIPKDTTKTLTIKADYPSTANGQAASTSIPASGIQFENPAGTLASSSIPTSALTSNDQYLFNAAPQWRLVSSNITAQAGVVGVASSSVTGTIVLEAKAVGGSMTKPALIDFGIVFASSTLSNGAYSTTSASGTQTALQASSTAITTDPTDATVGDGSTYRVTLTGVAPSSASSGIGAAQTLFMAIKFINSAVSGSANLSQQTWGINDFFTPPAYLTKGTF